MNLKKFVTFALTAIFAGILFTGCGQDDPVKKEFDKKIGLISHMNVSENINNEILKNINHMAGRKLAYDLVYFDDLNSLELGLQSKSIDEMSVYSCVGNYIVARDPKIEFVKELPVNLNDEFCFAVREEDTELKNSVDSAINSMKSDGTLDNLIKTYITDLKGEPPAVEISKIDGADTIKVGITGDLPPLDLILADGTPAGFNTAVLSEISKRIGKNIELVQINSAARAAALTSKKIDLLFWAVRPANDVIPANIDKPAGIEFSEPYFKDKVVHLELKK